MTENTTPFKLGYSMPAEWVCHDATWISWPKNPMSFPEDILPEVEKTYVAMVSALAEGEKVNILVDDATTEERVRSILPNVKNSDSILIHQIKTADVWFRDYGPIFVTHSGPNGAGTAFTHWEFNAWGNKYDDLKADTEIPSRLPIKGMPEFKAPMVLEGGSIDVNGRGALITTEQCLLNKNRNPDLTREQIELNLREYLGATKVIWLKGGIEGDDTDGHIDDVARFVSPDTVACAVDEDKVDGNYGILQENYRTLMGASDQDGKRLKVVPLPMPGPVIIHGQRLPASYANFYISNAAVLVPTFQDENDSKALDIIRGMFPGRKVVGINCRELVYGFGTIHCATQQQPGI